MKKYVIGVIIAIIILGALAFLRFVVGGDEDTWIWQGGEWVKHGQPAAPKPTQLLGGDRDEHGCIPSAGYSWCQSKQKCLRIWEESCPVTK